MSTGAKYVYNLTFFYTCYTNVLWYLTRLLKSMHNENQRGPPKIKTFSTNGICLMRHCMIKIPQTITQ